MTIFYGIIQWILSVAEILLCYYFCDVLMDRGLVRRSWIYVGCWSIVVGTLLNINRYLGFMSYNMILFQCVLIFISLMIKIWSNGNKVYCLGVILTYNVSLALLQLFNAFAFLVLDKKIHIEEIYNVINLERMICYLISLVVIYGLTRVVDRYNKSAAVNFESAKWILLVYGVAGLLVVVAFQTQMVTYGKSGSMTNIIFLSFLLVIALTGALLYIRYMVTRAEYQMLGLRNRMMEKHYREMNQMYQNCACSIHDFKNHLLLVEDYCKNGQVQKALAYMEKIRGPVQNIEHYIKSGNEVVDLILNTKLSKAKEKGIDVETEIQNIQGISIEENDLCSIFANLIDNALEACDAIKQGMKYIHVLLKNQGDMVIVKIENTFGNELWVEQGRYRTSKKGVHGYGMKSVQQKVEKYGGTVKWSHTEEVFTTVVTFFSAASIQKKAEVEEYGKNPGGDQSGGGLATGNAGRA